ncbi:MAG: NAD/NADP octopine/nopaline dehydrogenase family protein [Pirellulales bacterium]|nr:NAD/NADP octopine/nopaline dehydrogenase family protein [Pirellulales bacterium]
MPAVLGGGNTAFAVAANLTLAGAEVTLVELPAFAASIEPIMGSRRILLGGAAHAGPATIAEVTTDFEAIRRHELVLLIVPSYGHRAFAEGCLPHLRAGQTVVLMPGNLGSLAFARLLQERGIGGVTLAETDTAPYVCRKVGPDAAHIWGVVQGMGLGVLPRGAGRRTQALLERWFPGVQLYPHVLACGLSAMNPVVHPAGVLLNAGRIERARGEFYFYEEGVTPSVCKLIYGLDAERLAIGRALGVELLPVDEAFYRAGFGPRGDLWSTINGSLMLTQLRAPGTIATRWLTEDVPYGLATWLLLAQGLGVSCPTMEAVVRLTGVICGQDFRAEARTLEDLGISGLSAPELLRRVTEPLPCQ